MSESWSPFLAYITGPPEFERYAIRRNFVEPPDYYTGSDSDPWTEDLGKARLYASVHDLGRDHHVLARRELSHLPQQTYRLEVEVTLIGEATEEEVRVYVDGALTIGLDYESHGPGPGLGTLVLAKTNLASLRADDRPQADPNPIP
jgi:hypothetical protein